MLNLSQLTEESGNPSVTCHPAYQVAMTGVVERAASGLALALILARTRRGKSKVNSMTRELEEGL